MESIYDREFTLENFLDVWGFDKSKIKNVFCNEKEKYNCNEKEKYNCNEKEKCNINLTLTDGQHLKLQIKNDKSHNNFSKYVHHRITFEYPSKWSVTNES